MNFLYLAVGLGVVCVVLAAVVARLWAISTDRFSLIPESVRMDPRGWIGLGTYLLAVLVILLTAFVDELRQDEFFKTIATLIVGAFIKDVVGWAYSATKSGSELAQANSRMVEDTLSKAPSNDNSGNDKPLEHVEEVNIDAENVNVKRKGQTT